MTPEAELEASVATTLWLEQQYGIVENRPASAFLSRITNRLADGARATMLHTSQKIADPFQGADVSWQVFILNVEEPNAFSVGAGTIFVTRGLILSLSSESALASVISHEMAHQILGHAKEALNEEPASLNSPIFVFSLDYEMAADSFGLEILRAARYNTANALDALSTAYRPMNSMEANDEKNILTLRAANIYQQTTKIAQTPSTDSIREYNKIKQILNTN